jgi:thiamine biosynthesis lipoprotein
MNSPGQSRRTFLGHLAWPLAAPLLANCGGKPQTKPEETAVYHWYGIGFGIEMSMEIHAVSREQGARLGTQCEDSIQAMENAFSLYQEDSELQRLNRERSLPAPSPLFRSLLVLSIDLSRRTIGYFQPAVHGAWQWIQNAEPGIDPTHHPDWQRHCEACDLRYVEISESGPIRLTHPLTQLTMNAIAQGYLADIVADQLREAGVASAMLHLGESHAIGRHPQGRPWNLAVTGNDATAIGTMSLSDAALAVSANSPDRLLIDPVARAIRRHDRVAAIVSAEGAAVADAFATAFAACPSTQWPSLAQAMANDPNAQVRVWGRRQLVYQHG